MYRYHSEVTLNASLEDVWDFFTRPQNLERLTPPAMGMEILSNTDERMQAGQNISYRVKPLLGIPMVWKAEIEVMEPMSFFIDRQVEGPYAYWRHIHRFESTEAGVLCTDDIDYRLPFGLLGKLGNSFIKKQMDELFHYRTLALEHEFGQSPRILEFSLA